MKQIDRFQKLHKAKTSNIVILNLVQNLVVETLKRVQGDIWSRVDLVFMKCPACKGGVIY
jgi:hypothetical protein